MIPDLKIRGSFFLHGSGERSTDNEAQLKRGVTNFAQDANLLKFPAIVIAPQCPPKNAVGQFARKPGSRELSL